MPKYIATFRTDADYAERVFAARTPKAALALARRFHEDRPEDLFFEEYTHGMPVEEIEISDRDGEQLAVWRDPYLCQRLAAADLLAALETQTEAAQAVIDAWEQGDLAAAVNGLDQTIAGARDVILKARGGAEGVRHEPAPEARPAGSIFCRTIG
jgi:hypothetical protein